MRIQHSALAACLVTGTLWAANDPFVGKWKVNPSKSKLTDEMKTQLDAARVLASHLTPASAV